MTMIPRVPLVLFPHPKTLDVLADCGVVLTGLSTLGADAASRDAAELLADYLEPMLGARLDVRDRGSVEFAVIPEVHPNPEWHRIVIAGGLVRVQAATRRGTLLAVQTLRQVAEATDAGIRFPSLEIEDWPDFEWRGAHLDVARHFMPLPFLQRFIDAIAAHKLTRLHLHLTDDQGWRLEVPAFPRLTEVGSVRSETVVPEYRSATWRDERPGDGVPHGGFYTGDELRDLVEYGLARGVEILPEIDLPGHMQAALTAYPHLKSCDHDFAVATGWGVSPHVMAVSDEALDFCRAVLDQLVEIFPFPYVHLGGDECPKGEWKASPVAQRRMAEKGLPDEEALQGWMLRQLVEHLRTRDRIVIGWDEILEGGVPDGVVVMSWQGEQGGIDAARLGRDVIMAPLHATYFDYREQADPDDLPDIGPITDLDTVAAFRVVPELLEADARERILGAQFQLWTERMPTPERVEFMAFPRASVFSEVVWGSPRETIGDRARLRVHMARLRRQGVAHRPLRP